MNEIPESLAGGRLTIDLNALCDNWLYLDRLAAASETSAVVKADAYGLGIVPVSKALWNAGCKTFFVAVPDEGMKVRNAIPDAEIYILNGLFEDALDVYKQYQLRPVLGGGVDLKLWLDFQNSSDAALPYALHVDTGMNRLGLREDELDALPDVRPTIVMSHFACADDREHPLNDQQISTFERVAKRFPQAKQSMANSAGVLVHPASHFDITRPGVALYGGEAVNNHSNPMKTVVKLEGRIAQKRIAKKGESIGYGATEVLQRDTKIATISVGYADGFLRAGSGTGVSLRKAQPEGGNVAIGNQKLPILGRVSMDLIGVDVSDVPEDVLAKTQWVELFGDTISVDDAAKAAGTIGYEMLTGLSQRYFRRYLGSSTSVS